MPKAIHDLLRRGYWNEAGAEGGEGGGGLTVEQLQAQLADMSKQFEAVKSKNDELLTEAKEAKRKKREAEELAQREAEEKAKKENDFEQLFKSSQEKSGRLENELNTLREGIAKEKQHSAAMQIANELAEGNNAKLLSEFVQRRLKYTDDGLKVTDANGNLTVSSLDDLMKEFQNDATYAALLKGSKASGGGASGGGNGGGAASKEITRSEFEKLNPARKMEFIKDGGKLIE